MRITQLAAVALQAEKLRLQRGVQRIVNRAAYGAVAAVFGVIAIAFAHVAGYDALCLVMRPHWAALVVLGIDAAITAVFAVMAARGLPDPVADEAAQVRDEAWRQMRNTLAFGAALRPVVRMIRRRPA